MEFKRRQRKEEIKKWNKDVIEEKLMDRTDFDAEYTRLFFSTKIHPVEILNLVEKVENERQCLFLVIT